MERLNLVLNVIFRDKPVLLLYQETLRTYPKLRAYSNRRPVNFSDARFLLVQKYDHANDKWEYCSYSQTPSNDVIPMPAIIYDTKYGKVYLNKGFIKDINEYLK